MTGPQKTNPHAGGRRGSGITVAFSKSSSSKEPNGRNRNWQGHGLPLNWRERLPDPETYYRERLGKVGPRNAGGWAPCRCPLHDDRNASLSVNMESGGWRCFAGCGSGDLLSFHMRLSGLSFPHAVRDLVGG